MNEAASFIATHERTLTDLIEEGLGVPEDAALLVYRDRSRERRVSLIFPNRSHRPARTPAPSFA